MDAQADLHPCYSNTLILVDFLMAWLNKESPLLHGETNQFIMVIE